MNKAKKAPTRLLSALALMALPTIVMAQGYYDDDIYYNPAKDTQKKVKTTQTKTNSNYSTDYRLTDFPAADTYTVNTGSTRDVDEYNRRGQFLVSDSVIGSASATNTDTYSNTRRIQRFHNDGIVEILNDDDYATYVVTDPATINVYVESPLYTPLYSPFYSSWYAPYGSLWGLPSWSFSYGFYNPWYWGPSFSLSWGPSWAWGPSWGWGGPAWRPNPGWGPAPGWGPSHGWGPGHNNGVWRPAGPAGGNSLPNYAGANTRPNGTTGRPSSVTTGRPNTTTSNARPSNPARPGASIRPVNTNSADRVVNGTSSGSHNRSNVNGYNSNSTHQGGAVNSPVRGRGGIGTNSNNNGTTTRSNSTRQSNYGGSFNNSSSGSSRSSGFGGGGRSSGGGNSGGGGGSRGRR